MIYQLLDEIRMQTAKYILYASPTHLNSFLAGHSHAMGYMKSMEGRGDFAGFHDWVAQKLGYAESTSGWAYMIEDQREDKKEALYLFWELLDEYRGISHQPLFSIKFQHEATTDRSWRGYSRAQKVWGTFKAIEKPLPEKIIIRKMNLKEEWYQMVALHSEEEILFIWSSEELEKVFKRANEIFGIEKGEWEILEKN